MKNQDNELLLEYKLIQYNLIQESSAENKNKKHIYINGNEEKNSFKRLTCSSFGS